jgi:hypothetical protein
MFQKILGIAFIALGPLLIIKTDLIYRQVGKIGWAEDKLGSGGTITLINILGLVLIFLGLILVLGFFDGIVSFIMGPVLQRQ